MAASGFAKNKSDALMCLIGDEDTVTGFLLAGIGEIDAKKNGNFLVVNAKTPVNQIEEAFKQYTARDDVAVILITQSCAEMIRGAVDDYDGMIPTVLEIPSKDNPYDPNKDSVMQRIMKKMVTTDER